MIGITKCSLSAGLEPVVKLLLTNDAFFHLFSSNNNCLFSQPPGCSVCFRLTCFGNVINWLFHTDSVNATVSQRDLCSSCVLVDCAFKLWCWFFISLQIWPCPYWRCSCSVQWITLSVELQYCAELYTELTLSIYTAHLVWLWDYCLWWSVLWLNHTC